MKPTPKPDTTDLKVKAPLHLCNTIVLVEDGFQYLHKYSIHMVERFVSTINDSYAELIKADPSVINATDIDQIEIFRSLYTELHKSLGRRVTPEDILKLLTEDKWSSYSATYVTDAISRRQVT